MRLTRSIERRKVPLAVPLLAIAIVALAVGDSGATFNLTFTTADQIHVGEANTGFVRAKCVLTNTGTEADEYDLLRLYQDIPVDWSASVCFGPGDGNCYAPFVDSVYANATPPGCGFPSCVGNSNFGLAPGESDTVSCYFSPTSEGSGYAALRVRSVGNPLQFGTLRLGAITDGVEVLIVDDDGEGAFESYYEAAVPGGIIQGTWDRSIDGMTSAELLNFQKVVWFTGSVTPSLTAPTLNASDRTAIASYLAGGGRLLLSGQDLGYDLCDLASPNYSAANVTWYETNLKTRYLGNNSASFSLNGVAADPISNGLNLAIQGGTGANNQTDPDILQALAGATTIWTYVAGGGTAGTRIVGSNYRAVDLGFGFEAISTAANRSTAMAHILSWLGVGLVAVDDDQAVAPRAFTLGPVHPNPFAPRTAIAFELAEAGVARLRILDPAGRVLRVLADGALGAGRHARDWDGRDAEGRAVAAGVYLAELSVQGRGSERVKLILLH